MAILSKHNDAFTVMVEFDTKPDSQAEVVSTLKGLADMFPAQPGFVSQHFHASHDGARVVSYVQWQTKADHERCFTNPDLQSRGAKLHELAQSGKATMNVRTYDIVESVESPRVRASADDTEATKELVLRYFQAWQRNDWDTLRSCLAPEISFAGGGAMAADQFVAMCQKGSSWRDVELLDSQFQPGRGAMLYRGIDEGKDEPVTVGELVRVTDGPDGPKITGLGAAIAYGAPVLPE